VAEALTERTVRVLPNTVPPLSTYCRTASRCSGVNVNGVPANVQDRQARDLAVAERHVTLINGHVDVRALAHLAEEFCMLYGSAP